MLGWEAKCMMASFLCFIFWVHLTSQAALLNRPVLKLSDKPKSKGPRESKPAKTQIPSYTSPTSMSKDKVSKPINDKDFLSSLLQTKPIAKPVQPKNKTLVPAKPSVVSAQPPPKSPSPLSKGIIWVYSLWLTSSRHLMIILFCPHYLPCRSAADLRSPRGPAG